MFNSFKHFSLHLDTQIGIRIINNLVIFTC